MPCRDAYDDLPTPGQYRDNPEHLDKINKLEAMMCALMNTITLSYPHMMDEIINEAENSGEVDIRDWFKQHYHEDIQRLEKKLKKNFSLHEQKMLKRILNNK
jgi:hypothetical protein